jgi:hypothetical protein
MDDDLLISNKFDKKMIDDNASVVISGTDNRYFNDDYLYVNVSSLMRNVDNEYDSDSIFRIPESFVCSGLNYANRHKLYPFQFKSIQCDTCDINIYIKVKKNDHIVYNDVRNVGRYNYDVFKISLSHVKCDILDQILNYEMNKLFDTDLFTITVTHTSSDSHYLMDSIDSMDSINSIDAINCMYNISVNDSSYKFIINVLINDDIPDKYKGGYNNANNYVIHLDKIYNNIKSIELINTQIPMNTNNVTCNNNKFYIKILDNTINEMFEIDIGTYTIGRLCKHLAHKLNKIKNVFKISCTDDGVIDIKIDKPYMFEFAFINAHRHNLYKSMGFKTYKTEGYVHSFSNKIYAGGKFEPFYAINMNDTKYILMDINKYENIYDTNTQQFYFNKIVASKCKKNYMNAPQIFQSVLKHLYILHISFYDEFGNYYDFNGKEHSFTLKIKYYIDKITGTNITSSRNADNVR